MVSYIGSNLRSEWHCWPQSLLCSACEKHCHGSAKCLGWYHLSFSDLTDLRFWFLFSYFGPFIVTHKLSSDLIVYQFVHPLLYLRLFPLIFPAIVSHSTISSLIHWGGLFLKDPLTLRLSWSFFCLVNNWVKWKVWDIIHRKFNSRLQTIGSKYALGGSTGPRWKARLFLVFQKIISYKYKKLAAT